MRKLLISCAAFAIASSAHAAGPICFDFRDYCDGLELSVNLDNGKITGYWRNTDCGGRDVWVTGRLISGEGFVKGDAGGPIYGFVIGLPLDGGMEMWVKDERVWIPWIIPLVYDWYTGPCLFDEGGVVSTLMVK